MKKEIQVFEEVALKEKIFTIRGCQVMLDSDLAELYNVETKYLNRVVKRNIERFPEEFGFKISESESKSLRCQFRTLKKWLIQNSILWKIMQSNAISDQKGKMEIRRGMEKNYYAHSLEVEPTEKWQPLEEHLKNVAEMTRLFADAFGAAIRVFRMIWEGR